MIDVDFEEADASFFKDPQQCPNVPGRNGILYLLRRDISSCLHHQILWPGAMAVLAGVDLLGKFHAGHDGTARGKIGQRFRDFLTTYFHPSSAGDEKAIWELRNALLHSFGLYSKNYQHFLLQDDGQSPLIKQQDDLTVVNIRRLHSCFEAAVENYRRALKQDAQLKTNFENMFGNYGEISIF